jgi:hypothetical protein
MCPLVDTNGPDFVESVIRNATTGPFVGEYAAMCARERCGYFGELLQPNICPILVNARKIVPMERMFSRPNIIGEEYPLRGMILIDFFKTCH